MLDTPTLNFPTFNPLNVDAYTLSDGNLNTGAAGDAGAVSTLAIDVTDSDGFYFEVSSSTAATYPDIGLQDADALALAGTTTISAYNTGRYTYRRQLMGTSMMKGQVHLMVQPTPPTLSVF